MKKGFPPPFPPERENKNKLPTWVIRALEEKGLSAEGLVFACSCDMDNEALYKDSWLFFDNKGLYIASGTQETVKPKRGHVPPEPKVTIEKIQSIPVGDIDSLTAERYTSTGRLVMSENGEDVPLTYFSLGKIGDLDEFARAFNSYKETGETGITPRMDDGPGKCKKCGAPCPPDKDFCREHDKNKGTAVRLLKFSGTHSI